MRLLQVEDGHKRKFREVCHLPPLGWQPQHLQDQAHLRVQARKGQRAVVRRGQGRTLLEGDAAGATSEKKKSDTILEHKERLKVQEALLWGPYFKKKEKKKVLQKCFTQFTELGQEIMRIYHTGLQSVPGFLVLNCKVHTVGATTYFL